MVHVPLHAPFQVQAPCVHLWIDLKPMCSVCWMRNCLLLPTGYAAQCILVALGYWTNLHPDHHIDRDSSRCSNSFPWLFTPVQLWYGQWIVNYESTVKHSCYKPFFVSNGHIASPHTQTSKKIKKNCTYLGVQYGIWLIKKKKVTHTSLLKTKPLSDTCCLHVNVDAIPPIISKLLP